MPLRRSVRLPLSRWLFALAPLLLGALPLQAAAQQACPRPLRAIVLALDSPSQGITRFLMDSTEALLAAAEVKREVLPMPFIRIPMELDAGRADVVTVSFTALEAYRQQWVSIQFLRMPVLLYEPTGAGDARSGDGPIGIMRGAPVPPALAPYADRLQPVSSYEMLFQMLAARRLAGAVGARPTTDLFLREHPGVAALVKPGPQIDERRMAIHFSRRLPPACLDRLVDTVLSRGAAITQQVFMQQYKGLNQEDYRVPIQVLTP